MDNSYTVEQIELLARYSSDNASDRLLFVWPLLVNGKVFARYERSNGERYWKEF